MTRITVQFCRNGQYGEVIYKSDELNEQQVVDEMHAKALPGISLKFLSSNGVILPTGYKGDARLYIEY